GSPSSPRSPRPPAPPTSPCGSTPSRGQWLPEWLCPASCVCFRGWRKMVIGRWLSEDGYQLSAIGYRRASGWDIARWLTVGAALVAARPKMGSDAGAGGRPQGPPLHRIRPDLNTAGDHRHPPAPPADNR